MRREAITSFGAGDYRVPVHGGWLYRMVARLTVALTFRCMHMFSSARGPSGAKLT